jgi:large conductance mechanosensitive channel
VGRRRPGRREGAVLVSPCPPVALEGVESASEDIGFGIGDAFISIGLVIQAEIMFLIVAFVLFLIVKAYNSYVAKPQDEGPSELDVLTEIRDELRASR